MKNTVADLIAYLAVLPPDTPVKLLEEHTSGYQTSTRWVDLDLRDIETSNNVVYISERWTRHGLYLGDN